MYVFNLMVETLSTFFYHACLQLKLNLLFELHYMMLLNKMCCVDENELG